MFNFFFNEKIEHAILKTRWLRKKRRAEKRKRDYNLFPQALSAESAWFFYASFQKDILRVK